MFSLLGRFRRHRATTGPDGPVPPIRLPARAILQRADEQMDDRSRSDGPGPHTTPGASGVDRTLTDESVAAGGTGDRVSNGRWMPQALAQPAATPAQPRTRDSR